MDRQKLIQTAIDGLPKSYAPYSHFHVSAALLCGDGTVFTGNNIENASYTPSVCAERCAFFKAVSEGRRDFTAIAVCGGPDGVIKDYCAPCGAAPLRKKRLPIWSEALWMAGFRTTRCQPC